MVLDIVLTIIFSLDVKIIHHVEFALGSCHGGVDPLVGFFRRILGDVSGNMNIHILPLAALGLVAGDGVAIGAAKRIQIGVDVHLVVKGIPVAFRINALLLHSHDEVNEQRVLLTFVKIQT